MTRILATCFGVPTVDKILCMCKPVFPIPSISYVAVKCEFLSQMIMKSPSLPMLFGGSSGLACILPAPNACLIQVLVLSGHQQLSYHAQWSLEGGVRKSEMEKKRKASVWHIIASQVHRPYSHMHFLLLVLAEPLAGPHSCWMDTFSSCSPLGGPGHSSCDPPCLHEVPISAFCPVVH